VYTDVRRGQQFFVQDVDHREQRAKDEEGLRLPEDPSRLEEPRSTGAGAVDDAVALILRSRHPIPQHPYNLD
jgi:hypothetical protein